MVLSSRQWVSLYGMILGILFAGVGVFLMIGNPDPVASFWLLVLAVGSALISAYCSWRLGLGESLKE